MLVLMAMAIAGAPPTALAAAGATAGTSVVAAFPRVNGTWDAETDAFTPTTTASVLQGSIKRTDVVTGWGSVVPWVIPSASAPGGLQVMLSGDKDNSGGPPNGTSFAQRKADGTWSDPVTTGLFGGATSSSAVTAIAGPDNQTPIYVFNYGGELVLQVGATGRSNSTGVNIADTQLGGKVQASGPRLGHDAAGRYWLTWSNSATGAIGVYLLQIDPASGQPIGSAAPAPNSTAPENGEGRIALACGAECRTVFHESDAQGNNTSKLGVWGVGDASATTVSGPVQPNAFITAAQAPSGGMWIAWHEDGTPAYHVELAGANGAGGSNKNIGQPTSNGLPVQNVAMAEANGDLVFVTNWLDTNTSLDAMWAQVIPGTAPVYSGPTKQTSTKVGTTVLTLVSPKNCVPAGNRIVAKLLVKSVKTRHRKVGKGLVKIKVKSVDFLIDGKRKNHDKRKPFKATLVLNGLTPGSTHVLAARALLKTHPGQPAIHRTVRVKFTICG
ncbi:MAG: hypothetical protein E6G41_07610 [Actinobacteria bacterium]|nr:MAG: hypothetical protein E6G41_07610 [Actinomycetota bacterium]